MDELTEWEIVQCHRICMVNKKSGLIVQTKTGLMGRTFNHEEQVNGKTIVHVVGGKLLCEHETLIFKGFID